MSKQTPGRLFLCELPVGERDGKMAYAKLEIVAPSQDPRYLVFSIARVEFSYEQKHKGFISTSKEEAEANARRLVACWNACEGIATDELEEIARTGGMLGPREDVAKIAEQRDKLRDVLLKYSIPIDTNNIALSCIEYGSDAVERELQRRAALATIGEPQ